MTAPESAAGSAMAIDGRGKVAARSAAAYEDEASASLVARLGGEGVVTGAAAAVAAVAAAMVVIVVISVIAGIHAVTGASPVEAIVVAPPK